ncbi:serine/threonine-protein kinase N1-like [Xenopus laevis]|uniref:Serine/threonine-protein kinase N1-like n=1 Tax=Xenopus laevis TaxID=8355 RepID=A0A8J1L8V8_XENLA|nr:serine/threonine-protein kinase N1-like [Xenopus laevis]
MITPEKEEQEKVENIEPENEEREKVHIVKPENEEQKKVENVEPEKEKEQCKESAFSKTPIPKELAGQPSRRYIEDYDLRSLLGKGGFGTVYLAKHKATGEKVAVKALHKQGIKKERAAKSVILEKNILKLAKRNQNPFLVGLFASFRSEHHVCLVTDYCAGGDLSTYLKENPLPRERVVFYSGCVVLGLQFLHQHNIIHRDIKPENILLDSDGYAKITDYGVAKRTLSYGNTTWSKGGTCYYMAPEMIKEIGYTKSVDWWAFGIMIYRMLTAKYPFNGSDRAILKHNITENQPQFPDTMSEDSIDIIERLLNKNPEMRLGSTDEDAEDVKKCSFYKVCSNFINNNNSAYESV